MKSSHELLYRGFLTEGMKVLSKNTSQGLPGSEVMTVNFIEFMDRKRQKEEDPEEIVDRIKAGLGALEDSEENECI